MKNLLTCLFLALIAASCSSTNSFNNSRIQKRKYTGGFHISKPAYTNNAANHNIVKEKKIATTINIDHKKDTNLPETINSDTTKLTMKNGEIIKGVVKKENENGILLTLSNGRSIYYLKDEISNISRSEFNTPKIEKVEANSQNKIEVTQNKQDEVIKENYFSKPPSNKNTTPPKKLKQNNISSLAIFTYIISIILSFFGIGLLLLIIGFFISKKGVEKAKLNPNTYSLPKALKVYNLFKNTLYTIGIIILMILLFALLLVIMI